MATQKSTVKSTTFWWDATATDPVIASALAVLAKRNTFRVTPLYMI